MANSLESRCQSGCQVVVRVVDNGLLSEGTCLSGCYLSYCYRRASVRGLLSVWLLSHRCCQRAAVRVTAVRELL